MIQMMEGFIDFLCKDHEEGDVFLGNVSDWDEEKWMRYSYLIGCQGAKQSRQKYFSDDESDLYKFAVENYTVHYYINKKDLLV
jgi:hypothetical protein